MTHSDTACPHHGLTAYPPWPPRQGGRPPYVTCRLSPVKAEGHSSKAHLYAYPLSLPWADPRHGAPRTRHTAPRPACRVSHKAPARPLLLRVSRVLAPPEGCPPPAAPPESPQNNKFKTSAPTPAPLNEQVAVVAKFKLTSLVMANLDVHRFAPARVTSAESAASPTSSWPASAHKPSRRPTADPYPSPSRSPSQAP